MPTTKKKYLLHKCGKNLKNNKACADDGITNEYIQVTLDTCKFIVVYEKYFNFVFETAKTRS